MRWDWSKPRNGATRSRDGFLLLPRCIEGEWRWLERADWIERYEDGYGVRYSGWYATEWMNP